MAQKPNKVVLNLEDVKIDADPVALARLIHDLVNNKDFRGVFEADPVGTLRSAGIHVPEEHALRITPETIEQGLAHFKERGGENAFMPGVGVAVDVGTGPGVRVGVQVGVESAVVTAVVAREPDAQLAARLRKEARLKGTPKPRK